jgi:hypothetical protein
VQLPSAVDHEHTHKGVGGKVSQELMPGAPMFCLSIELLDIFHEILETVYTVQIETRGRRIAREQPKAESSA